jgi:hypothetical protein
LETAHGEEDDDNDEEEEEEEVAGSNLLLLLAVCPFESAVFVVDVDEGDVPPPPRATNVIPL